MYYIKYILYNILHLLKIKFELNKKNKMLTIPQASCCDNIKIVMIKYCQFKGRARRSEFWYFKLFIYIFNLLYSLLFQIINNIKNEENLDEEYDITNNVVALIIFIIINAIFIIPNISVSVRRLHDVGRSGFFYFLNLIPVIGQLILLYFYLQDSFPDTNEYGPSTKYILPSEFSRKTPFVNNSLNEMQEIS